MTTQLLTVDELATFLQVPPATVYQWRHKRVGPPAIKVGRYLRWRLSDVETWLDAQLLAR